MVWYSKTGLYPFLRMKGNQSKSPIVLGHVLLGSKERNVEEDIRLLKS
jgi:hypothetical protein